MTEESFDKIELENISARSNAVTLIFVFMTIPIPFLLLSKGMIIGVAIYFFTIVLFLYFSLFVFSKSDATYLYFDKNKIKIKRNISVLSGEEEIIIPFNKVGHISTYSPLFGGSGIKIWSTEKSFYKIRTIGDSRGGRFIRFSLKSGPNILKEDYIKDSLEPSQLQLGVHITKFTETLLNSLKELGYKAVY